MPDKRSDREPDTDSPPWQSPTQEYSPFGPAVPVSAATPAGHPTAEYPQAPWGSLSPSAPGFRPPERQRRSWVVGGVAVIGLLVVCLFIGVVSGIADPFASAHPDAGSAPRSQPAAAAAAPLPSPSATPSPATTSPATPSPAAPRPVAAPKAPSPSPKKTVKPSKKPSPSPSRTSPSPTPMQTARGVRQYQRCFEPDQYGLDYHGTLFRCTQAPGDPHYKWRRVSS